MLLKQPIHSRDAEALEKVQKLALKFVKGLWHANGFVCCPSHTGESVET